MGEECSPLSLAKFSREPLTKEPVESRYKTSGQGGLATAFDLAAFRLSMIAPVKKTVNHLRTHVSMCTIAREIMQMCQLMQKCVFVYGKDWQI